MFAIIWALIGGFRGILVAAVTASAVATAAYGYNQLIDNPAVVREARAGFVLQAERDALVFRLAEEHRQRRAAEAAKAGLQFQLAEEARNAEARAEILEREIEEYERKLDAEGRTCHLNDADLEWLRHGKIGNPPRKD